MNNYIKQRENDLKKMFVYIVTPNVLEDEMITFQKQTIIGLLEREIERLEGEKKETGIKMYSNKRTGEMGYLYGKSPSSVCIGCGQKKKAEEQGFNQSIQELISHYQHQIEELKK